MHRITKVSNPSNRILVIGKFPFVSIRFESKSIKFGSVTNARFFCNYIVMLFLYRLFWKKKEESRNVSYKKQGLKKSGVFNSPIYYLTLKIIFKLNLSQFTPKSRGELGDEKIIIIANAVQLFCCDKRFWTTMEWLRFNQW